MNAQQLKNTILQEAIEGRLVPQDPNDEPASVLLARIRKEKERLVKEGKLKKKDLEVKPISEDEIPFEIPDSWEWCRVEDIIYPPKYGTSNKSLSNGAVPVLRMGNIQDGEIVFDKLVYSNDISDNEKYNLTNGDLLFNRTNSAELVGKTGIYRGQRPAIYAGYLILLRPIGMNPDYLNFVLGSSYARSYCKEVKTIGVQQCNINAEKISSFIIPLPPLAEQHRIVAKIEELLPKIVEYGKAQETLDKLNEELPERLKKSILQEAIEGRLVPQDPNDEPASVLLAKIRKEKAQLVKEGKLKKKDVIETPISEDEIPFEIPDSWEWVRLGSVCDYIHRGKSPKYGEKKKLPILAQKCNQWEHIYTDRCLFAQEETIDRYTEEQFLRKGDIVINSTGGGTVGRTGYVDDYVFKEYKRFVVDSHVTIVRGNKEVLGKYIYYFLISPLIQFGLEDRCSGSTNQIELGTTTICNYLFPLPPIAEQYRIVKKLEQLFGEIDKLKK